MSGIVLSLFNLNFTTNVAIEVLVTNRENQLWATNKRNKLKGYSESQRISKKFTEPGLEMCRNKIKQHQYICCKTDILSVLTEKP